METISDYAIIYNPQSAAGKSKKGIALAEKCLNDLNIKYTLFKSEYPGHAIELATQCAKDGFSVIAAGGDGTCNEVMHGVIISKTGALCGFIPMGSGNDIPAAIGVRSDIKRACEILAEHNTNKFDIGFAKTDSGVERYFLGIGSQGFDALVTKRTNEGKKWLPGTWNYIASVIRTISSWKNRKVRVILDDQSFEIECNLVAVGNGPSYGGMMYICNNAKVHDGKFHITIVQMGKMKLLIDFNKMYDASLTPHPNVLEYVSKKVRIEMVKDESFNEKHSYICQVDGEVLGAIPVTYECIENGYEFICPTCDEVAESFKTKYNRYFYEPHH